MNALIFAQTIYYLTFSLLILTVLVLAGIGSYYLISVAKNLAKLSEDLNQASEEVKANVSEIFDRLSQLPFFSYLLKKSEAANKHLKKGRNNK